MKFSISKTDKYKGYSLDVDASDEVFSLLDSKGTTIKSFGWDEVINYILERESNDTNRNRRNDPRTPLSVKIKYKDKIGKTYESITDIIGGGGLFIESLTPLPEGSSVSLEFSLPDRPREIISADGEVVWVRQKFEHILYYPGMGVRYTNISEKDKDKLIRMINSLNELRGEKVYW